VTPTRPKVLFVCLGNMIRSQMAEGFGRHFGGERLEVFSAGLNPTGAVAQSAIEAMAQKGIDISGHTSKGLGDVPLNEMDYVVTMTGHKAESIVPASFAGTPVTWDISDPIGRSDATYRTVRDEIEQLVKTLIDSIKT